MVKQFRLQPPAQRRKQPLSASLRNFYAYSRRHHGKMSLMVWGYHAPNTRRRLGHGPMAAKQ